MYQLLWHKFITFFTRQSRAVRWTTAVLIIAVVCAGLFGVVQPAHAQFWDPVDWVTSALSTLLLWIASILGKILVVLIDILLGIIQYNDFVRSAAVSKGWVVVRDLCNMFFVAVLLIIAFGTILRIESYKYQRLLPQLIIMAVLINFSKLIAGFLIDVSQVILLTFANSFKDSAAGNFVNVFQLKEMLGFIKTDGTMAPTATPPTGMEKIGIPIFAIILLVVALFVMLAMIVVFLARIVYLWVLIVLSPLAYLLAVVPMGKQYASRWWSTFGKWVTTGPVLAFFIWLALSVLATPSGNPATVINLSGNQGSTVNEGLVTAGLGNLSSSENILGFMLAVAMLVMAMGFAQALGGFAGKFAGNMMSKMGKLGSGALKIAGAPLKGGWELTKSGGRKLRREWRDSAVGKYTNVGAILAGAKKRGDEVERRSKERAIGRGENIWDSRPKALGGGVDVVDAEAEADAKNIRAMSADVSKLQKEQKADYLREVWSRGGYEADIMRRTLVMSLASEGHPDDALETEFFRNEAQWTDPNGVARRGYSKNVETGEYREAGKEYTPEEEEKFRVFSNSEITQDIFQSAVSTGAARSAEAQHITPSAARTLYELEELGKKANHHEYAGGGKFKPGDKNMAPTTQEEKKAIFKGEINKPTTRQYIGLHPHNFSEEILSKKGEVMRIIGRDKNLQEYENFVRLSGLAKKDPGEISRFSPTRFGDFLGKVEINKETGEGYFEEHNDDLFQEHLKELYQDHGEFAKAIENKLGISSYKVKDENGNEVMAKGLDEVARIKGWDPSITYHEKDEKAKGGAKSSDQQPEPTQQPRHQEEEEDESELRDVSRQAYEATKTKADEYQKRGMGNFFASAEYEKGAASGQFLEQERYDEAKRLEEYRAPIDRKQYEATHTKVEEMQKNGQDFFESDEYKNAKEGQYLNQNKYNSGRQLEADRLAQGLPAKDQLMAYPTDRLRGVASFGAKDSRNVLGVDFKNLDIEELKNAAGEYITDPELLNNKIKPKLLEMIDGELAKLNSEPLKERSAYNMQRIRALTAAKDKINDEEQFKKLKLANIGRTGFDARHVLTHENMHEQLENIDPNGRLQQQLWQEMSPEARKIATEQVKRKMTNQNMSEAQVVSEYFAEGLANAGPATRADRSASAITLPPAALQRLAAKVQENAPKTMFTTPLDERIVVPTAISGRERKQAGKQAKAAEKQQGNDVLKQVKMEADLKESEKELLAAQMDARQKNAVFESAQKARKGLETSQLPQRRAINERAGQLQLQAENEKALMEEASAKGDKVAAKQHQQNFNKLVPEINKAATQLEDLGREIETTKKAEDAAKQGLRMAADQVQAQSTKVKGKSNALESFKTGTINATYAKDKAQRDVQQLTANNITDEAGAAQINNALRNGHYTSALTQLEYLKKKIGTLPAEYTDDYAQEISKLQGKIASANTSLKFNLPGQMTDKIKADLSRWETDLKKISETYSVDKIQKNLISNIPVVKAVHTPSPRENIDELTRKALELTIAKVEGRGGESTPAMSGRQEAEKQAIDAAVQKEMESIAPSSQTMAKTEVQASTANIGHLLEQINTSGIDNQTFQDVMGSLQKEIIHLSSALQGQQKNTEKFVNEITNPLSRQAQAGSMGQFGASSQEWQKFMYNMNNLYKFFRDKSPKKNDSTGNQGGNSGVDHKDVTDINP